MTRNRSLPAEAVLLDMLRANECAEVVDVSGDSDWVHRMAELGVGPGSHIQMIRPGNPCLLLIGGSRLSLRGESAMQILVVPLATPRP